MEEQERVKKARLQRFKEEMEEKERIKKQKIDADAKREDDEQAAGDTLDSFMETVEKPDANIDEKKDPSKVRVWSDDERDLLDEMADAEEESSKQLTYHDLVHKVGNKKDLAAVDHKSIDYQPFRKQFYVQVKEISLMKDHELFAFRKANGDIKVRGRHCPRPIKTFYQCGLPDKILKLIEKRQYETPFPIQMQALPCIMAGRDVIGVAETGSGKTLAFLLPMLRHILDQPPLKDGDGPIGLILAPTRELCLQIHQEVARFGKAVGLTSAAVYGGTGIGAQLSILKRGVCIVTATPGRFIDVLSTSAGKVTNLRRVTFTVLDEADRMFDMGFEPQITAITRNIRPDRQTVLFSATFPVHVEAIARKILRKPIEIIVGEKGRSAAKVRQYIEVRPEAEKFYRLLQLLGEWHEHGSIIIFVSKQREADDLFKELLKYGYPSAVLHGGQDQEDRDFTIQDFKDGVKTILVATSVAARGLDVKSVVLVINFRCPDHLEDYIHRIGRTGRADNIGVAYTFVTPKESGIAPDLVKVLTQSGQDVPQALQAMADEEKLGTNLAGKKKVKKGGGFGGKGFKFTSVEKSQRQKDRQAAKTDLGIGAEKEEDEEAEQQAAAEAASSAPKQLSVAQQIGPITDAKGEINPAAWKATALAKVGIMPVAAEASAAINQNDVDTQAALLAARSVLHIKDEAERKTQLTQLTSSIKAALLQQSAVGLLAAQAVSRLAQPTNPGGVHGAPMETGYVDPSTGNYVDEFEINDYPEQARHKITRRDVQFEVKYMTGAVLQVKGQYFPPGTTAAPNEKKLYVEIIGPNKVVAQRAKHEVRQLMETVAMKQLNTDALRAQQGGTSGRYTVIGR